MIISESHGACKSRGVVLMPRYLEDMPKEKAMEMIEYEPQGAFVRETLS
jgi:hypothetical protein